MARGSVSKLLKRKRREEAARASKNAQRCIYEEKMEWGDALKRELAKVEPIKGSVEMKHKPSEILPVLMRNQQFQDLIALLAGAKRRAPLPHAVLLMTLMQLPQGPPFSAVNAALRMLTGACQWASKVEQEWFLSSLRPVVEMFLDEAASAALAQRDAWEATTSTFEKGTYGRELKATSDVEMEIDASDCVALSLDDEELIGESVRRIECFVSNPSPLVLWFWDAEHPVIAAALDGQLIRITKLAKRTTLNRMVSALHVLCEPPRRAKKKEGNIKERLQVQHAPSERLKQILLPFPLEDEERFALSKKPVEPKQLEGEEPSPGLPLNFSQTRALNAAACRSLTLIQGPPGTGKTTTCVQILRRWAMMAPAKRKKTIGILATSGSNIAVDNILEGLVAVGINAVRLGRPEIMRPEVSRCVVENVAMAKIGVSSFKDVPEKVKRKAIQDALEGAQVICCTVVTAGSALLRDFRFPLVLVDEASQVTEPATLIPICRGCQQLVLCGDHCQLPPTVKSDSPNLEALKLSLFERLSLEGVKPLLLNIQYRMHPLLSGFPSGCFYNQQLQDGKPADEFDLPQAWPFDKPLAVIPVATPEEKTGHSYHNSGEAQEVCYLVERIVYAGQEMSGIGVICAYDAQVKLVRQMLKDQGIATGRSGRVEVTSVDGFQGREKDTIIMSLVRSESEKGVGFLRDWRRANVGLTRARLGLAVVCNPSTLSKEKSTWLPWLHWVRDNQCFVMKEVKQEVQLPRPVKTARPVGIMALQDRVLPVRERSRSRSPPPRWAAPDFTFAPRAIVREMVREMVSHC